MSLLLLLAGCASPEWQEKILGYVDQDGDWLTGEDDCDETNKNINVNAEDTPYSGVDENCDEKCDFDLDGDNFADASHWSQYQSYLSTISGTEKPNLCETISTTQQDCDDSANGVNPSVEEVDDDSVDNDCDGTVDIPDIVTAYEDNDGDGYGDDATAQSMTAEEAEAQGLITVGGDCDDTEATINPGATEICDGLDNDCDSLTDDDDDSIEGQSTWYQDLDGDTYGTSSTVTLSCDDPFSGNGVFTDGDCNDDNPSAYPDAAVSEDCLAEDLNCDGALDNADGDGDGLAACDGDCDDTNININPSALEVCDDVDNDCDLLIDDLDDSVDVTTGSTWYADTDADGYGTPYDQIMACDLPTGYSATADDCDDAVSSINPGAAEACDADNIDEDCDGLADNDDLPSSGTTDYFVDSDEDGYGSDIAIATPYCDDPLDGSVPNNDDCDDSDPLTNPDTLWYFDGDGDGYGDPDVSLALASCTDPGADYVDNPYDCDDTDAAVTPDVTWYADNDSDGYGDPLNGYPACEQPTGYVEDATDCDDAVYSTNPGADEVCDGEDNDCNGTSDDTYATDALTWYADSDADGYGVSSTTTPACEQPSGYSPYSTDCDDTTSTRSPANTEVCDAADLDEDCDLLSDDDDTSATGKSTVYVDADGDTYGSTTTATYCDVPATGYAVTSTDCDDTRSSVNTAASETCSTTYDDDCDGTANEDSAVDASTWYLDSDSDGYGVSTTTQAACTQPSSYSAYSTDCDDTTSARSPALTEICDAADLDEDCDSLSDDDDSSVTGTTAWYTDADGDGYGDPASSLGSSCEQPASSASNTGDCDDTEELAYTSATEECNDFVDNDCDPSTDAACELDATIDLGTTFSAKLVGEDAGDLAGSALAYADPNGDGYSDVLIGAYSDDDGGTDAGAIYILNASFSGTKDLSTADSKLIGENAGDYAGRALSSAGDTDGDGFEELLVGAYLNDAGGTDAGAAYLLQGPISAGSTDLSLADAIYKGESAGDNAGRSVSSAGDIDGDGYSDLLIGANQDDDGGSNAGAAYLLLGTTPSSTLTSYYMKLIGENTGDSAGFAVASAGDTDGDGLDDVLVGAYSSDNTAADAGTAYLLTSYSASTTLDLSAASAIWNGESSGDQAGVSISPAGDTNLDGYDDFLVGASLDDDGGTDAGAAYLVLGPTSGTNNLNGASAKMTGMAASDYAGRNVGGNGDVNGDGYPDFLIGAYSENTGGTDAGAAYLIYGPISGSIPLSTSDTILIGDAAGDNEGHSVDISGDLNGDGFYDLLTGADRNDAGGSNAGAAYLSLGIGR